MAKPRSFPAVAGVVVGLLLAGTAAAHHSFAMFDQSRSVTLQGVVREFRWTNPHAFIQLLAPGAGDGQEEWSIEMASPSHLARAGWRPRTLKPGDPITLVIHPMRDATRAGQYLSAIGPNGPLSGGPSQRAAAPAGGGK